MLRRHAQSAVAPSAYVFPGGTVRDDDASLGLDARDAAALARSISERSEVPLNPAMAVALYTCAMRELFEEAGVLLVEGEPPAISPERLSAARREAQAGTLSLADLLAQLEVEPAFDRLVPFSHWVTPSLLNRRFDTRFFLAELPADQHALHCDIETTDGVWLAPSALLAGDYELVFPTLQHVRRLSGFSTTAELLEFGRTKRILRVEPTVRESSAGLSAFIDPAVVDRW